MALFMQNQRDIKICVIVNCFGSETTYYKILAFGIRIIITEESLTFKLNCQSFKPRDNIIKTEIPFGIVILNNSCMASNKHLQLPGYFGKHNMFEMSDPLYSLLKIQNISKFHIWNNSKTEFAKLNSLSLPSYLLGLKEIPMQVFIHGMKTCKTVNVNDNTKISWLLIV